MRISLLPQNLPSHPLVTFIKHPRTNQLSPFIITDSKLYEILEVGKSPSSFLLMHQSISNGDLLIAAEIHPLFLAIPLIMERSSELYSLDGYFDNTELQTIEFLIKPHFPKVCEAVQVDQYVVWTYNEKKMMDWLCLKISRLITYVYRNNPNDDYVLVEQAFDIIRHYIRASLAQKLKEELQKRYPGSFPKIVLNISQNHTRRQIKPLNSSSVDDLSRSDSTSLENEKKDSQQNSPKTRKDQGNQPRVNKRASKKKSEVKIAKNCLESFFAPQKKK
ncbi:hypothetical protein TRFO_25921 [Tritrichomonas foetus]|uniref:Uncharacterized protein n=1 Tax=Tritrichomonas foetus TaxID=1144522 RepID=A0A1J4K581_9EUKA|nr:hypothetical protein TRFO_25921 [Tritrichomonas foetus]|eukprot:OHT06138.1 hypothetical protein TRFO_25921 [Tritrichomonas foetus]